MTFTSAAFKLGVKNGLVTVEAGGYSPYPGQVKNDAGEISRLAVPGQVIPESSSGDA